MKKSLGNPDPPSPKTLGLWALGYCQSYSFLFDFETKFCVVHVRLLCNMVAIMGAAIMKKGEGWRKEKGVPPMLMCVLTSKE